MKIAPGFVPENEMKNINKVRLEYTKKQKPTANRKIKVD